MPAPTQRLHAEAIFAAAIDAVRPAPRIQRALQESDLAAALAQARRVVVVGGGKAGAGMVEGVEAAFVDRLKAITGIVNIPDVRWWPTEAVKLVPARSSGVNEPTQTARDGTNEMLKLIATATPDDVILVLLSGGGSALLPAPAEGIALEDKIVVARELSAAGATIHELNCVRKHLSRIKGGWLAEAASHAASVWSLIISDVVGNRLDVIASGPTAPDPTTFGDALAIINKYGLAITMPSAVIARLQVGAAGIISETPKALPANVHNRIIAANEDAMLAAKQKARALGYDVINLGNEIADNTSEVARVVSTYIPDEPAPRPLCVLLGGETTVALGDNPGKGGRNQEFVLALANEIKMHQHVNNRLTILSGGTDGEDGPTDAAGAIWDTDILMESAQLNLDPARYLKSHDSYNFFQQTGGLLKTGLTGTNVMDVRIVLIGDVYH
jgi:glycerate 2-kinase